MNKSYKSDRDRLLLELELYMAKARVDARYGADPLFDKQLEFWQESLRFCINELEIWEKQANDEKYDEAYNHAQDCLDKIAALVGGE